MVYINDGEISNLKISLLAHKHMSHTEFTIVYFISINVKLY